jgi:hypothetical protein
VIVTLANAIAAALPELIPTIVDVVLEIVDILTEPNTLSALVDAAIAIIVALAQGLINALPRLIEKAPEIVANLVTAIITNAPKLLAAAVQLMATLAQGIVQNIFAVINAIGQMWSSIVSSITGFIQSAWNWGKDLIESFTNGIKAFISKPIDAIKGLASKIKSFLGFSEPEEGPLSNFHTYAPDMMALFARGIRENEGLVTGQIDESFAVAPRIARAMEAPGPLAAPAEAAARFSRLLGELDLPRPAARAGDFPILRRSVNAERLGNHPYALDEDAIDALYHQILEGEAHEG